MIVNSKEEKYSEISHLKEEIKTKEKSKKENENDKDDKPLTIFGNNINDRKPKYYGKTRTLLYCKETPILILGEDRNFFIYLIFIIPLY